MKTLLMIAAFGASASLLVPTLAEARTFEEFEQVITTVRYDDLDLTTAKGLAVLDRRIGTALLKICDDPGRRDLVLSVATRQCIDGGKSEAAREIRLAVGKAQARKASA